MKYEQALAKRFEYWQAAVDERVQATIAQARAMREPGVNVAHEQLLSQLSIMVARGGKRLRPMLCMLFYEGYAGTKPTPAVVQVAASLELLHTFLLLHDDITDRDTSAGAARILSGYTKRNLRST